MYKSALEKSNTSGNFCSRKCYTEYQKTLKGNKNNHYTRKDVKCPTCGRIFKALPSKMKMYKNTFCSFECKNAYMKEYIGGEKNCNWKGGESKYRGDFNEVKKKYFIGKQHCAICGKTTNIHIHHIIPYRLTQDNSINNLIPLCNKHHKQVEAATLKFIELFNGDGYIKAKNYMNCLLRGIQFETYSKIQRRKNELAD